MKFFHNVFFILIVTLSFLHANASPEADETKRTFYFVRHGITDWKMNDLLDGPQDLNLNNQGKKDIEEMASLFNEVKESAKERPTSICYSHLKRCVETSAILSQELSLSGEPVHNLHEVYRGDWSKLDDQQKEKARSFLKEKDYKALDDIQVADAEPWNKFLERIDMGMKECLKVHQGSPIIVTHGQVVKEFLKLKQCWSEGLAKQWSGDSRPPLKVFYDGKTCTAAVVMKKE